MELSDENEWIDQNSWKGMRLCVNVIAESLAATFWTVKGMKVFLQFPYYSLSNYFAPFASATKAKADRDSLYAWMGTK